MNGGPSLTPRRKRRSHLCPGCPEPSFQPGGPEDCPFCKDFVPIPDDEGGDE